MILNEKFDKIICINSKKRVDRYRNMFGSSGRFKELGMKVERFPAIHGGDIDKRELKFDNPLKALDNGEIGCYLSHVAIWKRMKQEGGKNWLILEDDALFKDGFEEVAKKEFPKDWDMLYFGQWNYDHPVNGGNGAGGKTFALKEKVSDNLYKADRCWLTHAYAVNERCLDYLIENTQNLYSSVDNVLADIQKNLKVYAYHPNLITQDNTKSSLRLRL